MGGKTMDEQIDPRPVYEADQVLTLRDLVGIRNGYIYQYVNTPWYNLHRRFMLRVGTGVCTALVHWLAHGKPEGGMSCGEQHEV